MSRSSLVRDTFVLEDLTTVRDSGWACSGGGRHLHALLTHRCSRIHLWEISTNHWNAILRSRSRKLHAAIQLSFLLQPFARIAWAAYNIPPNFHRGHVARFLAEPCRSPRESYESGTNQLGTIPPSHAKDKFAYYYSSNAIKSHKNLYRSSGESREPRWNAITEAILAGE